MKLRKLITSEFSFLAELFLSMLGLRLYLKQIKSSKLQNESQYCELSKNARQIITNNERFMLFPFKSRVGRVGQEVHAGNEKASSTI